MDAMVLEALKKLRADTSLLDASATRAIDSAAKDGQTVASVVRMRREIDAARRDLDALADSDARDERARHEAQHAAEKASAEAARIADAQSREAGLRASLAECSRAKPFQNIAEGKAVACGEAGAIYRYTGGELRHYPNPTIAAAWDKDWGNFEVVDCAGIPEGAAMGFAPPLAVPEGRAVKCDEAGGVYRYTGGELRYYPSPAIATAWDRGWGTPELVDCAGIPEGKAMGLAPPLAVPDGQSVKCGEAGAIYRYTGGELRHYPNPTIADTWDQHWGNPVVADCAGIPEGAAMGAAPPSVYSLRERRNVNGHDIRWLNLSDTRSDSKNVSICQQECDKLGPKCRGFVYKTGDNNGCHLKSNFAEGDVFKRSTGGFQLFTKQGT
jgi:hypothetical protein